LDGQVPTDQNDFPGTSGPYRGLLAPSPPQ